MKIQVIVALLISSTTFCIAQTKNAFESLKVDDLKFRSFFGFNRNDTTTVFSLLGTGYFRATQSGSTDSLIHAWIEKHPNAMIIPVTSIGPAKIVDRNCNLIYCWVVYNADTLNNFMIKSGCFPGGTMQRPRTWSEMTKPERRMYNDKLNVSVYVDKKSYARFLLQINSAEVSARKDRLGIWQK